MPGDYDGDGVADLVVFRPSSGNWFNCSSKTGFDCSVATVEQFGLPEDIPITADYDADGVLDKALYRPATGQWYSRTSGTSAFGVRQWGLPQDTPLCAGYAYQMRKLAEVD